MSTPAGLMLPTAKSYAPGAGNPRDSAMISQQQMNESQNNLNKSVGGKRRKHKTRGLYAKGGANSDVVVPQFQMQYTPQGGPGTNPNDQISNISSTSMQTTAWKANDNLATKMGGTKRVSNKKKKGGNPDWLWGCYSGGKKSKRLVKRRKNKTKKRNSRHLKL